MPPIDNRNLTPKQLRAIARVRQTKTDVDDAKEELQYALVDFDRAIRDASKAGNKQTTIAEASGETVSFVWKLITPRARPDSYSIKIPLPKDTNDDRSVLS